MAASVIGRHRSSSILLALALLGGCVQEQDYVIVEKAVWFTDREACTLDDTTDTPLAMTVDVSYPTRIAMGFVVTNDQVQNKADNSGINNTKVEIETAEVTLSYSGGAVASDSFELTMPNNTIAGGDSQVFLVQAPTEVTESLRASLSPDQFETLEMSVVFVGRRTGASGGKALGEIRTREYTYPFDICLGCLNDCMVAECGVCPTPAAGEWTGTCGFAQGLSVYNPICDDNS
jgi:hypothetical protein